MKLFNWNPSEWAGLMPNGIGQVKPNHYGEMVKVAWQNRDNLGKAWRILNEGVCDGCALGTAGLKDFTLPGPHVCTVRLHLLRLNTMPGLDAALLSDVSALRKKSSRELRDLGRLPYPMIRRRGEPGFTRISWDQALDVAADGIRQTTPGRTAFYLTSRGITNEVYYVAQKVARYLGTSHVDNAARICHSPCTVAMKQALGVSASTCSYEDWLGTDYLVFIGSDTPNNQPVTTKYIYRAKQRGTKVIVINPYREPGLDKYWVPSVFESAVFGTKLTNEFFPIQTGGDVAFLSGVLKYLIERNWVDRGYIAAHTEGFHEVEAELAARSWESLEQGAGLTRADMLRFAEMLGLAKSAVFVWSMGITQHENGVDNVRAILNLALARGFIGREKCGAMPIRGHSGVQGGGEMGCSPWSLPGGDPLDEAHAAALSARYGFEVPAWKGNACLDMIDSAHAGGLDVFYVMGGNFLETLPDPQFVTDALSRPKLRVHQDIVLTSQMLVDPADTVLLLPAQTRYEQEGGCTETSTERQIIFSPYVTPAPGEARSEWQILMQLAQRAHPERAHLITFKDAQAIREEIGQVVPFYDGIQRLKAKGDHVQWGGRRLCEAGGFKTPTGRAQFSSLPLPDSHIGPSQFLVKTRRGKQFNSIIQYDRDPLNGAMREDVLINPDDARGLGVGEGDWVVLRSDTGSMDARIKIAPIKSRSIQVHWPEGNVLLKHGVRDPESGVPAYRALVTITKKTE